MKRYLKKYPPLLGNMPVLPDNVEECPASVLRSAFPNGWKAALPKSKGIAEVFRLGRTWPLRITHVVASAAKNAEPSQDMAMLPSAVIGMAATVAQQTTMALAESSTKEEELPGFKLLRPAHVAPNTASASTPSVPALMDQAPNSNVQPSEPEKSDPQKLIDSLREDLAEEKKQDISKPKKAKVPKKSSKPKSRANFKCPAAAGAGNLRRPAAALPAGANHCKPLDADPKRAALLSRIPADMLSKFSEGCGRCKYRKYCTISCWERRGYT